MGGNTNAIGDRVLWVVFLFSSCLLSCTKKIVQDFWEKSLSDMRQHKHIAIWCDGYIFRFHLGMVCRRHQSCVTKVVGHHDGWIQRCKIQGGNDFVIKSPFWLNHSCSLEFVSRIISFSKSSVRQLDSTNTRDTHNLCYDANLLLSHIFVCFWFFFALFFSETAMKK